MDEITVIGGSSLVEDRAIGNGAIMAPAEYPASRNPALVYLASLGASSRRPMTQSLNAIAAKLGYEPVMVSDGKRKKDVSFTIVNWSALRYEHTQALRTLIAEQHQPATANRHLSALRGVLKESWRLGYMDAEDYQRAVDLAPVKGQKASQAESGRHLGASEINALMTACADGTIAGIRDAAIISVGYGCGLRRAEIAGLDLADYDPDVGSVRIRHGKGNKERVTYIPAGAASALEAWIRERGEHEGALFCSIRRGDHLQDGGITEQAVYTILAKRAVEAGVKSFTPHDLRRTFAGDMLDAGEDLSTVQKMMGHSKADTTAGYDRRDSRAKKRAAGKLHIPFFGKGDK